MNNKSTIRLFLTDFATVALSFLIFLAIMTITSIVVIGSREEGMGFGLIIGFVAGLATFYYFRGQFNLIWTILQIIVNGILTIGELFGVWWLLEGTTISEISYGYLLILISIPSLISINKQIIDHLTIQMNGQKRI
jgi:hypothetical protein